MKTSFLDYYKVILGKVSFSRDLFHKEYHKALGTLSKSEGNALRRWLIRQRNLQKQVLSLGLLPLESNKKL